MEQVKLVKKNTNLMNEFNKLLKDEEFKEYIDKLKIPYEELSKYTTILETCKNEYYNCKNCKSILECKNKIEGCLYLPINKNGIRFCYKPCKYKKNIEKKTKYLDNIYTFNIPSNIKEANIKDIYKKDENRFEVIKYLLQFTDDYINKKNPKGLYLYGNFGCGKTYLISAVFNELAKQNIDSAIVFWPEYLRMLKSLFNDNSEFRKNYDRVKNTKLLLIDDLGAENSTTWSRDEILCPILQYRMENNLPTFITSNLNLDALEKHLSFNGSESIKAKRIIERINHELEIQEMIDEIIINIKKQKNIKLFYKLLIDKIDKKIITIASLVSNYNFKEELEKNMILLKKYSNINQYIKDKNQIFEKTYVVEKNVNNKDIIKISNQKYKFEINNEENIEDKIYTITHNEIYSDLKRNIQKEKYEINDIIIAFTKYINIVDVIPNISEINEIFDELYNRLYEFLYENKSIFFEFSYLVDVLSNVYKKYDKESIERKLLKPIYKKFTTLYKIYKTKIVKDVNDPYFDIINYWLNNENNYLYLKELINRKPNIRNLHYNGEHIVIYILNKYIDNFKKMIVNEEYININYLREVYYLFTKNYCLRLTKEEKITVDTTIKEFIVYIKNTLIKERRKNAAINDLKSMKTSTFYPQIQDYVFRENTMDELTYDKRRIYNNSTSNIKNKCVTDAFLVSNYAYNIIEASDEIILKMYTFNIGNYIMDNSIINLELEKCEFNKEKIDEFVSREFDFKLGEKYPTICYQLKFYKSGKIKSLDVSRENIEIKDKITTFDIEKMDKFYELYKKSINKNNGVETNYNLLEINKHFEHILNNEFVKFIKENKLPFIYCGYTLPMVEEIEENMNALAPFLHNLNKDVAYEIINIVSSKIDKTHYSLFPIENAEYDLKLIDSFNYIGILNQKMLNDIYFNDYNFETEERKNKEKKSRLIKFYKITKELNDSFNYIDVSEIKESKGKIKRSFKIN